MQNKPLNPYQDLKMVRSAAMFFGRTTLLRRLYSAVANKQCVSLVGPRHIGKSSLLACMGIPAIQQQFDDDLHSLVFVPLDLRSYRQRTSEFFFEAVSEQIATQCRDLGLLVGSRKGSDEFSFMLRQMEEKGLYPVLLMDAFDNITGNTCFDFEFFSFMRSLAQAGNVSFVTASIAPLNDICRQDVKESPFFNIFSLYRLGPLTQNEAQDLIAIPAQRSGCPFTAREQEWILSLAGRHPFFLQRVCFLLFEEKCQYDLSDLSPIDLDLVEELVYTELKPHFVSLWAETTVDEQQQFENHTRLGGTFHNIRPELSESALFRRFVREKYDICISSAISHITVKDFEKILDNIDDLPTLGESDLKYLRVVSMRLKNHITHSPIEVGRAMREILQDALERLKGSDTLPNSGAEWRLYNILHFRYFKRTIYRMNSEQIAARLSYDSVRSYYRDRSRAVAVLLQEVLDMEKALY